MQFTKRFAAQDVTTPFMVYETSPFVIFRVNLALIYFYNTLKRYGEQITWFLPPPLGRNSWLDYRIPNLLTRTLLCINHSIDPFPPSPTPPPPKKKKMEQGFLKKDTYKTARWRGGHCLFFSFFFFSFFWQGKWSVL